MHWIQFGLIVNLIRMKSMKMIGDLKNMTNQEFQTVKGCPTAKNSFGVNRRIGRCCARRDFFPRTFPHQQARGLPFAGRGVAGSAGLDSIDAMILLGIVLQ
jgi:hypothetical protein